MYFVMLISSRQYEWGSLSSFVICHLKLKLGVCLIGHSVAKATYDVEKTVVSLSPMTGHLSDTNIT